MKTVIDDRYINLEKLAETKFVKLSQEENFKKEINNSHQFLIFQIKEGKPIYGVTTGYGASGKNYLSFEEAQSLQQNLYRFHGCGVGEFLSKEEFFFALLIRMISLSKGKSAISFELLEQFELLINKNILPLIPSQGSVGASGDLTPLSYIAAVIAGEREVYYEDEILPTKEVYQKLNIKPYIFKPKEALAVMNGTAIMSAIALNSLLKFEILLNSMESFVAGLFEVLLSDSTPLEEFVHNCKPFIGQQISAKNIREKIKNSKLTHNIDNRYDSFFGDSELNIQDSYSIRCSPQILGVVRDNLEISKKWVEIEINSVNDNPLIDFLNKKIYTSGNFYGGYVAHAMDTLKICVGNVADLLDKEFALMVDYKFNRNLGENLKYTKENFYHGFKAMQITLSSLSADILKNTTPASIFSRPTESLNQDKVSMGTTAALDFKKMLFDLENMLSIAFLGLAQGVDIRGEEKVSPYLKNIHTKIRQEVKVLKEDRRMDIDIAKVKKLLLNGEFE